MRIYNFNTAPKTHKAKPAFLKSLRQSWKNQSWKERVRSLPWKRIGTWAFRLSAAGILGLAFLFIYFSQSLPDPNRLLGRDVAQSTKIYARDGTTLLYEVHGEVKRTLVNLDQMSPFVQQATIAAEDRNFYNHAGISLTGLGRSVIVDIMAGEKRQGGSTITQQFVKNAVLTREKSFWRKLKEIILSIEIEARFTKDEILKMYLNEIPYGRNAYGIEAASQTYFGKSAKDLTLAQSAYLAALPQAPTFYNPTGPNRDALDARQEYILNAMRDLGYINEEQHSQAMEEKVEFSAVKNNITAPYFVFFVQDYLAAKYGERSLQEGGLKVTTSLDPRLQTLAEETVAQGVTKNGLPRGAHNAALVATDPKTGQILAMVGGKDYFGQNEPAGCTPGKNCRFEPNVNVATAQRQPGSSFKPYAYLTAFGRDFKYAPASMLMDVVTNFGNFGGKNYVPQNYNLRTYGPVSMRQALAGSLNIPAVKTLALVGVDNVTKTAHDLGVTSRMQNCGLSLVLGGCEVRLVDHVSAFGAIGNMGEKHDQTAILKVEGQEGEILEEYEDKSQQVVDPQAAYELISIMTDNSARSFIFGSSSALNYPGRQVACKTGTTQDWRDGWTLCFTPSLSVGVWAGNNDGTLMKQGADGSFVAAPLVKQFLTGALQGTPSEEFRQPDGITRVTVDSVSGKLPTEFTPSTKSEVFADYAVPKDRDNIHIGIKIDTTTGERATDLTPPENIGTKIYTVFRSERPDDPNWENPVIAWARANGFGPPPQEGPLVTDTDRPQVSIESPADNSTVPAGSFQVTVNASSPKGIARVELSVDGDRVDSSESENGPYVFQVNRELSNGDHTVSARAIDKDGISRETSINISVGTQGRGSLSLVEPDSGTIDFPLDLIAESRTNYSGVNFYYQGTSGSAQLIGQGSAGNPIGGFYQYEVLWANKPPSGTYQIFARSGNTTSSRVTVVVE